MVRDRQRIILNTRAGLECHERIKVPTTKTTRFVVIIRSGARVSVNQIGINISRRRNSAVNAGRVVAEVAVVCVLRKSVSLKRGSSRILQRDVKSWRAATISSSDR